MDRGRPLMQVLKDRKSSRVFSQKKIPLQVLSDLLWAAFGINRPASGMRTAASAMNYQEIDIYVSTADGLYVYDAKANVLNPLMGEDIRVYTGTQDFVKDVPVNLIYVSDLSKMSGIPEDQKIFYSAVNTGCITENVYLYCASEGLATVVRGLIDKPALEKKMGLKNGKVIVAQSVGYEK
jgi:nitroreductase